MPVYPLSFYENDLAVQHQRTSVPTGMLQDPLDLVNRSRPWVMVGAANTQTASTKKTLIFADLAYRFRPFQEKIEAALVVLAGEFNIYMLTNDDRLEPFDVNQLPTYQLNLDTYQHEKIYQLAHQQLGGLSANKIKILDYFALNELMETLRTLPLKNNYISIRNDNLSPVIMTPAI